MDMPSYACECMRPELKHAITLTKPACIRISFPLFNVYIKYTEMYMHRRQKKGGKEKEGRITWVQMRRITLRLVDSAKTATRIRLALRQVRGFSEWGSRVHIWYMVGWGGVGSGVGWEWVVSRHAARFFF